MWRSLVGRTGICCYFRRGWPIHKEKKLKRTWARSTYTEEQEVWGGSPVVMAVAPAIVGGGEGVYEMQQSGSSGGGVCDDQRRRTATERSGKARCSGCSGEDNMVGVASVDGEESKDLVKTDVGIGRNRHTGLRRLTRVGNLR